MAFFSIKCKVNVSDFLSVALGSLYHICNQVIRQHKVLVCCRLGTFSRLFWSSRTRLSISFDKAPQLYVFHTFALFRNLKNGKLPCGVCDPSGDFPFLNTSFMSLLFFLQTSKVLCTDWSFNTRINPLVCPPTFLILIMLQINCFDLDILFLHLSPL